MIRILSATGEPALVLGALNAILALIVSFGIHLSADQVGAINATVAAILAVVLRQAVQPAQK